MAEMALHFAIDVRRPLPLFCIWPSRNQPDHLGAQEQPVISQIWHDPDVQDCCGMARGPPAASRSGPALLNTPLSAPPQDGPVGVGHGLDMGWTALFPDQPFGPYLLFLCMANLKGADVDASLLPSARLGRSRLILFRYTSAASASDLCF